MKLTIELPSDIEAALEAGWGGDLPRATLEALAIESYRQELLSLGK